MKTAIDQRIKAGLNAAYVESESDLLIETRKQLSAYFAGELRLFELPSMGLAVKTHGPYAPSAHALAAGVRIR